ncbi:MAG: hypothetical protein J0H29_12385 [Sphingobacteriales bacterium]|uniref:DUF6326 family protein n=1 Tax=uncultured Flavobacterium sp. TaxID=165435 RepID=UPI000963E254|nr:DUF6326 family protein [uncultured Flavobacterium sp.]MBN8859182.1 hypothetical protein [Sphingobacteriales bacterium]OJY81915.1 MAG: hypothetical protein BGP14_03945 [Sphingobacteriales bacterium 44-15]
MKSKKYQYEDFKINVKLVLSALWASVMFLYIYGDYFELYVPEKVAALLNGQNILNTPYKLLFATIILTLPSLMIFLSLLMKPKWNKVLNISIGIFLTLFTLLVGVSSFTEWRIFYVMLSFLESIITSIIVWKAWHWSKD